ncbi:amidohydrolase family protein [Streptomyces sp. NPDC047002]|uniref:amidohydrolase family protein n=1 Tax=Streptomyces sp. NPDC047002 TaxID=3155475 RepID=UPI003452C840
MYDLVIRNGRVVDHASGTDRYADLAVEGGRIAAVEDEISAPTRSVVEADGCYVLPGLVDLHVHLDTGYGGDAGHAMLARAGVTTALDLGTPSAADVFALADRYGTGLTIACVVRLVPGLHLPAAPSRGEIRAAFHRVLADGALGVKIHVDSGWSVESAAAIAETAHEMGVWLAVHCGTTSAGSDIEGLRQTVAYLDGGPAHIAHVNSYCRGELGTPEDEAREAVALLRGSPRLFAESYLAEINGNVADCENGLPKVARVAEWLAGGGYPGTEEGLRAAILDGWAAIPLRDGDRTVPLSGPAAVRAWEEAGTHTGLCLPLNPAASRVPLVGSKNAGGAFDVAAIATDGGGIPRNVTVRAGLSLVELGALSLKEFVQKASWTPARTLGLENKGTLAAGADADVAVVDRVSKSVVTTVAAGHVVYHRGTVIPRRPRLLTTGRATAAELADATRTDPAASGLYTGAGRREQGSEAA